MDTRWRRTLTTLVALASLTAACGGGGTAGTNPAPAPTSTATAAPTAAPTPAVAFLEDTGLERLIPPGEYLSRVFRPELSIHLGEGWMRRDDINESRFNLRRIADASEDVTFIGRVDYLQCGDGALISAPTSEAILAAVTASDQLTIADPWQAPVGARSGTVLRLAGGEPIADDVAQALDFGCVLSTGDEAFPAESAWTFLTRDQTVQYVLVDVDGTPVLIRSRPGDTTRDLEAFYDLTLELLAGVQLG